MLLKYALSSHYKTNTTNKATLHVRLLKHRPTNYYLAKWLTETTTYPFYHSMFLSKSKAPVRIVLKSPFHYKKPKHRVSTYHTKAHLTTTTYVPPLKKSKSITKGAALQKLNWMASMILTTIRADGGSLPTKHARVRLILPLNIWDR